MTELPIRYALFDMDGTLTDTMDFWRYCVDEFLAEEGLSLTDEQCRQMEGMPLDASMAFIHSLHLSPRADRLSYEDLCRILLVHYEKDAVAKAGVTEMLASLQKRGVTMGIATLTPSPLARVCLARTGLASYFSFILGGEEYPEGKRETRIFLDAARRFGCAPTEMHLFEDSYYSIKTARSLGIPVIGVADKYQAHHREKILAASVAFFEDGFTRRIK